MAEAHFHKVSIERVTPETEHAVRDRFAIPAALYSIWMFVSALGYIAIVRRRRPDPPEPEPA